MKKTLLIAVSVLLLPVCGNAQVDVGLSNEQPTLMSPGLMTRESEGLRDETMHRLGAATAMLVLGAEDTHWRGPSTVDGEPLGFRSGTPGNDGVLRLALARVQQVAMRVQPASQTQPRPGAQSWAKRHPVLLGALIGATGGGVAGFAYGAGLHGDSDVSGVWFVMGAGAGAGLGAVAGLILR